MKMGHFQTLLVLNLAYTVCAPAEQLAVALQKASYTASGAKQAASSLYDLNSAMNENDLNRIWEESERQSADQNPELQIVEPPRSRQAPRRLGEVGGNATPAQLSAKDRMRQKFISVLDWLKSELKRRFDQAGMDQLIALENLLLQDREESFKNADDIATVLGVHKEDFDIEMLEAHIKIARTVIPDKVKNVKMYADAIKELPDISRKMFCEVERLVMLLLTVPATSS